MFPSSVEPPALRALLHSQAAYQKHHAGHGGPCRVQPDSLAVGQNMLKNMGK